MTLGWLEAMNYTNQLIFSVLIFYKSFGDLEKVIASRPIDFFKKFISLPVDQCVRVFLLQEGASL